MGVQPCNGNELVRGPQVEECQLVYSSRSKLLCNFYSMYVIYKYGRQQRYIYIYIYINANITGAIR